MDQPVNPITCLTFCGLPYAGNGWPQSCVSILAGFADTPLNPMLVLPRIRHAVPASIKTVTALPSPFSKLPWRLVVNSGRALLEKRFASLLQAADPASTVAYFWPGAPIKLVRQAKALGILTAREMINTAQGSAKPTLDFAYESLGLPSAHTITQTAIEDENEELALYDLICASNEPCEASLREAGVGADNIFPTSFGWSPSRYGDAGEQDTEFRHNKKTRFLFAGSISVRKGVPTLLEAWGMRKSDAELTLVGTVEPALKSLIGKATQDGSVHVLPFTDDIGALYRSHDVFVFPTVEEGGPQVTIEAGGLGLPVITTPMGAARLVKDGTNGIIVATGAATELSAAIDLLATNAILRQIYSWRIASDAQNYTYKKLGADRALAFLDRLKSHQNRERARHD